MIEVNISYFNTLIKNQDLLTYISETYSFPNDLITIVDDIESNRDLDIKWVVEVSLLKKNKNSLELLFPNSIVTSQKYRVNNIEPQDFMAGPPILFFEYDTLDDAVSKAKEMLDVVLNDLDPSIKYSTVDIIENNGLITEVYSKIENIDLALENTSFHVWDHKANKYLVNSKTALYEKIDDIRQSMIDELKNTSARIYRVLTDPLGWHEVAEYIDY